MSSQNGVISSVTRFGKYEPFDLQVARNQVNGHSTVSIFGYQSSITTTSIPVWENATTYAYPASAATMTLASSSSSDNGATVLITGLDANFSPISEVVTIATGGTSTANSFLRINGMVLTAPASGQVTNVGTITLKISTTIYGQINIGAGKSQAAIYSVPANCTFYLDWVEANTSNSYTSGNYLTYRVVTNNNTNGVQLSVLQQPFTSIYTASRVADPFAYPQKTDIQWQLQTSASTYAGGIIVTGKLIQNANITSP